MVVQIEVANGT